MEQKVTAKVPMLAVSRKVNNAIRKAIEDERWITNPRLTELLTDIYRAPKKELEHDFWYEVRKRVHLGAVLQDVLADFLGVSADDIFKIQCTKEPDIPDDTYILVSFWEENELV